MIKGLNVAANGMNSLLEYTDVIANNLANVNTPGFKKSQAIFQSFQDVLVNQLDNPRDENYSNVVGNLNTGSNINSTVIDFSQGGLMNTGNKLDLAINGNGFFTIQKPDGQNVYTRNGSFSIDENGYLTTKDGFKVMGESGPIKTNTNNSEESKNKNQEIIIDKTGNVFAGKNKLGKLNIADFANRSDLKELGQCYYETNQRPTKAKNTEINQGYLESSNSNVVEGMVNTIEGSRSYEAIAKYVTQRDKTIEKTVTQVGLVRL